MSSHRSSQQSLPLDDQALKVLRVGCRYDKPTLFVEYENLEEHKVYTKRIHFKKCLHPDATAVVKDLIRKFPSLLNTSKIATKKLEDIVQDLLFSDRSNSNKSSVQSVSTSSASSTLSSSANKLSASSISSLVPSSSSMSSTLNATTSSSTSSFATKKDSTTKENFTPSSNNTRTSQPTTLFSGIKNKFPLPDDIEALLGDDDDDEYSFEPISKSKQKSSFLDNKKPTTITSIPPPKKGFFAYDSPSVTSTEPVINAFEKKRKEEAEILHMDLNKAPDHINRKAKKLMELEFEKNRLKPGDAGYVWNKQIEFAPAEEENEWDD